LYRIFTWQLSPSELSLSAPIEITAMVLLKTFRQKFHRKRKLVKYARCAGMIILDSKARILIAKSVCRFLKWHDYQVLPGD